MFSLSRHALRRIQLAILYKNSAPTIKIASITTNPTLRHSIGVIFAATAAANGEGEKINQRNFSDSKQIDAEANKTANISSKQQQQRKPDNMENKSQKITVNKDDLKKRLTPLQYQVTQEAATERPFTGCYNKHYEKGMYQCIVCHQDLFSSDTKYDSGCGWPAFNDVLDKGKVTLHRDASIPERIRTEVRCASCNAHMGHVFEDGPKPTRKRYCINSAAIEFVSNDGEDVNSTTTTATKSATGTTPTMQATPIAQQ